MIASLFARLTRSLCYSTADTVYIISNWLIVCHKDIDGYRPEFTSLIRCVHFFNPRSGGSKRELQAE